MVATINFYISVTTLAPINKDDIMRAIKKEFPQSFVKMWFIDERSL